MHIIAFDLSFTNDLVPSQSNTWQFFIEMQQLRQHFSPVSALQVVISKRLTFYWAQSKL